MMIVYDKVHAKLSTARGLFCNRLSIHSCISLVRGTLGPLWVSVTVVVVFFSLGSV